MIDLLVEGFSALRLACTLAVLVPGIGATLVSRSHAWKAVTFFVLGAGLTGWARFADLFLGPPGPILLVLLGLVVAASLLLTLQRPVIAPVAGAIAGVVAGWMWVPCVGEHLAAPLNEAATDRVGTIGPIFFYILGVSIPLIALALAPYALPRLADVRDHDRVAHVGFGVGLLIALAIAAGFYGDIIQALAPDVL